MKIGPKYKLAKRLGASVFEKTQTQKFQLSEERSSRMRRRGRKPRTLSNYGRQLIEKQRVRFTYGTTEQQLARYANKAREKRGVDSAGQLFQILETRLDNSVYRLGLARTRRTARQMVSHGHITVNGKKVTVASATVREGDVISVRGGSHAKVLFTAEAERMQEYQPPTWLRFDAKKLEGTVVGIPLWNPIEVAFDLHEVLEFYSK
ncbi:MAG TPA: 30S ribosomal protein S4 [Candidatus Paceibacterota bacterium]|jgi:small subunit ribosomal protein S4